MPRFDGTGPQGKGPGTGRGLGPCKSGAEKNFTSTEKTLGKRLRRGNRNK